MGKGKQMSKRRGDERSKGVKGRGEEGHLGDSPQTSNLSAATVLRVSSILSITALTHEPAFRSSVTVISQFFLDSPFCHLTSADGYFWACFRILLSFIR